ncbi:hypothetical protein EDC04DRAFT_2905980 [Pisolithus marmoratus]|nr:hypothetical protein EDC04DRAFT_2905980 [Pisolithus marmoratus]
MPRAANISEPSADSAADLHTRVLRNRRIPSSQNAPASKRASKCGDAASVGSDDGGNILQQSTMGVTSNKPKPQRSVQPPEGWEEHMFGLRDRRRSLTPRASTTNTPVLPSPSQHHEGQVYDEDAEMEEVEEDSNDNVDEPRSSSEQDEPKSSSEQDEEKTSAEEDDRSSNYNESEDSSSNYDVSGDQSSLPPSSPPADQSDDSDPDVEETVPSPCQGRQTYPRLQNKGKGRALDAEDVDMADHSDREVPPPNFKKPGNLSKAALEEIRAFAKNIKTTAEELGRRHGRSSRDILVAAGFGVKPSHTKLNEANLFRSWYWATQPKPDGADRDAVNNLITKEYNSLMKDIPKDDFAARREKLKAVYEWSESSSVIPTNRSVKSIAARVDNAKTQFSGLAEAWSNLEDIEIVGAVMYVGQDPAGRQTSGIFGGSEAIRNFINENSIDVRALLDKYTAIFKCLRNGDGIDAGLVHAGSPGDLSTALELRCHVKETSRDHNRRVFGSMMKEKLLAALRDLRLTYGIEVSDPQKVAWHRLLEFMRKCHLTVVNWPHGVSPPGPGFDHKKLKAGPLHQLVVPYLRRKLGAMYDGQTDDEEEQDGLDDAPEIDIKCWNQVPLVKAADGTVLRKISDDPEWQKSRQERDRQQQQDSEVRQQRKLPFRSRKRPRVEVSNDDTIPRQSGQQAPPRDEDQDARPTALDLCPDPSIIPAGARTREPDRSDFPALAPQYRVGFFIPTYLIDNKANENAVQDLHRDMLPSRTHTREPGPPQQPLPRRREDSRNDRANYRDPGPSNIPYNAPPPVYYNRLPPSRQGYRIPSRTDHHAYHDGPYINDYYPSAQPAAPHWVNRGGTTQQYEDDFPGDYVEDYF